jgi:hypothetical protein
MYELILTRIFKRFSAGFQLSLKGVADNGNNSLFYKGRQARGRLALRGI